MLLSREKLSVIISSAFSLFVLMKSNIFDKSEAMFLLEMFFIFVLNKTYMHQILYECLLSMW